MCFGSLSPRAAHQQPFLFVTIQVSSSGRVLLHEVIPFMDTLTDHLDKYRNDEELPPVVRAAAYRGRKILDKYYTSTDNSIIYRIAMSTPFFANDSTSYL